MQRLIRYFGLMFLGVAIFMPLGAQSGRLWAANSLGTEARDDHDRDVKIKIHRYYDRDHKDYHQWNDAEDRAYRHYLEEQREQYRDFAKQQRKEQRAYWKWRHEHPGDSWEHR